MPDPTSPSDWIDEELRLLNQNNLLRNRTTRESPPVAGMVQIDGRQFINFGSNDYLGIAASPELVLTVQNSVSQLGVGSGASPLVNGRGTIHRRLEEDIARFEKCESALLFPTGYAANIGVISCLVGKGDVIYSDSLNHASIIDGCRLSGANIVVFPHSDIAALRKLIKQSNQYAKKLIVTDGLFSMDGDVAKLAELCEMADDHQSMLVVDEAHASGVLGASGRGTCELLGVEDKITAKIGTLSKAIGCIGGFVAGKRKLIEYVFNRARSQVFSTAIPEINAAAAIEALKIVQNEPQRRHRLSALSETVRNKIVELGLSIGKSETHIIPVILDDAQSVVEASKKLQNEGVFVPAIRPPSVPENQARLRISLCADHTPEQVDLLLETLAKT